MPSCYPRALAAGALALLAACATDHPATGPDAGPPPDLAGAAFQLTIEVSTGRVSVTAPRSTSQAVRSTGQGPAFSLLGSEVIALHATSCTFTAIPNNSKQKRCTFDLAVEDRLEFSDLVTPTTFPRPPQGTTGILVFPYSAAALGVPGGSATPTTDWDNAPANFFNDFGGCAGGRTSDCYRSERYPSPLYAGETNAARRVGFDVDKSAQSVSAYIVVAADLRENPVRTVTLDADASNTGYVFLNQDDDDPGILSAIDVRTGAALSNARGFVSFDLPDLTGKQVVSAVLQLYQTATNAGAYGDDNAVVVEHVDYGPTLFANDYSIASLPPGGNLGRISVDQTLEQKTLEVAEAVNDDVTNARVRSQYRLIWETGVGGAGPSQSATFEAAVSSIGPHLVLRYRDQ